MGIRRGLGLGLVAGGVGLLAMELVRRATAPLVKERARKPTDVFVTERTISQVGIHHEPGESAPEAIGRIGYQKLVGEEPSKKTKSDLSWAIHLGYGLLVASGYALLRGHAHGHTLRDGLMFGTGLWLFGDELAVPLLGLADKPSAYHPTQHLQSFAQHLGFGVATAATTRALEAFR
jgi:uncharacterized membrane protein YagU involved in acid resistance